MNDSISRQSVIDALKKISFSHWFECGEYISEDTREIEIINNNKAQKAIEDLPSTQPEYRWIPVSEKLPSFAQRVLVSISNFVYEAIYFDEDAGWSTYNVTFKDVEESEILAWMPLPEPYKEEQA